MENISRRAFVGSAAGVAAMGASMIAMSPVARGDEDGDVEMDSLEKPADVAESDITSTIDCDVLVVGCGIAGMSAARAAAENGANVVVVEKSPSFNTRKGFGCQLGCINSKYTRDLYTLDGAHMVSRLMEQMAQYPSQQMLRYWADNSGADVEWFLGLIPEDHVKIWPITTADDQAQMQSYLGSIGADDLVIGVKSADYRVSATTETYPTGRYPEWAANITVNWDPATGFDLPMSTMEAYVTGQGGTFLYGHKGLYLQKDGDRVSGVIAEDLVNGGYVRVNATNTIVSCGDISGSAALKAIYYDYHDFGPGLFGAYTDANGEFTCNLGEGHKMCLWAGACMEKAPFAPMAHGFDDFELIVDENCVRAVNENLGRQELTNWLVARNKRPAYGINHGEKYATIADAAAELGLDADALQKAVDDYNALCATGVDTEYGKDASLLIPIEAPYDVKQCSYGAMLVLMGGIDCNLDCQALDEDSNVVEGLYVAGNTMGRRFNVEYPMLVNGISNGSAISFGKLAGTRAAQNL